LPWKTLRVSHRTPLGPQAPQTIIILEIFQNKHTRIDPVGDSFYSAVSNFASINMSNTQTTSDGVIARAARRGNP
jgi:hypothetical protein